MEKFISKPKKWLIIVVPFTFGFVFTSIFRSMNAVLAPNLESFGLSQTQAGIMSSSYFLAFAIFQIPLGVWLDKYHVKNVQAALFLLAAIGSLCFGLSSSFWFFSLYRVVIAFGLSGGLMAAFKIAGEWFESHELPFVNGMIVTFGSMGTLISATPVALYVKYFSFFSLFLWLSILLVILSVIIFTFCPNDPSPKSDERFLKQIKGYQVILKNSNFLRIVPTVAITFATFSLLRSYWMNPIISNINGLSQNEIFSIIFYSSVAFIIGSTAQGATGSSLAKKNKGVLPIIYFNCGFFILISIFANFEFFPPLVSWPLLSFIPPWALLAFSIVPSYYTKHYKGRSITAITLIIFFLIFTGGSLFGYIVDLFQLVFNAKHSYQLTWSCIIFLQVIALVWANIKRCNS